MVDYGILFDGMHPKANIELSQGQPENTHTHAHTHIHTHTHTGTLIVSFLNKTVSQWQQTPECIFKISLTYSHRNPIRQSMLLQVQ